MKTTDKKHGRRHENREDLTGEHALGDLGQLVFLVLFLAAWILDTVFIRYSAFVTDRIPLVVRLPLGVAVMVLSGYLAYSGLKIVFGEIREPPSVIRKGVFRWVRHPIYLGALLFYLGLLAFSFSFVAAVVWVAIIGFYVLISKHEERLLLQKFGKDYEDYMKEVPMLVPRIARRRPRI